MADSKLRLVIVDGYGLLFRAFFAPGPYLSTAEGLPTAALFGFTNSLLSVLEQEKPDAIYVAWDPPGKTFRHDSYEDYKGHRPEAAEDLRRQLPVARQLVEAFGIAAAEVPRFEADDLIGTLASRAVKEGYEVVIVTGDTDQLQLVGDGVKVKMVRRGVTESKLYDEEAVRERYGIPPERIPDFKALVGDTSDNIPGVPGIGDKTATKLLQEFDTVDNLLAHAQELPPGRVRDNLVAAGEQPLRSRELATIHCEAPFEGPIQRYQPTPETWDRVRAMFTQLEFRSLLRRLPEPREEQAAPPTDSFSVETGIVETREQWDSLSAEIAAAGTLALRTHAENNQPMRAGLLGVALAWAAGKAWYVRLRTGDAGRGTGHGLFEEDKTVEGFALPVAELRGLLLGSAIELAGHNAKFDQIVLTRFGAPPHPFAFDTMIAAYLLQPGRSSYDLGPLAEEHLRLRREEHGSACPEQRLAEEAALVLALREPLRDRLAEQKLDDIMYRVEVPLVPVLSEMEREGVPVDTAWLDRLAGEMKQKMDQTAARIYELAGEEFTIGSTQQLQRVLFEKLQLPTGKKIKTGYSTRAELLESLAPEYEICARILEYREVSKLKSTYADALPRLVNPETGRLHTSLNQTVAATGRLSSSDPNLQNIPVRSEIGREIRKAFIAPKGQVLLSCDYSQIELRIFAHVTRDPEMMRAFEADEDIHAATATRLFNVELDGVTPEMRRRAKMVNFAVIYGQSDFGLANTLGIPASDARQFIERYFAQFPGVRRYTEETLVLARSQGWVQTLLGRRRYLPEINSGNFNIRQAAERAAVNMPIQGTAADIMKLAMIEVYRQLHDSCSGCVLLLQVHDELVFGVDTHAMEPVAQQMVRIMEEAYSLDVRLRVDAKAGSNWAEMTPLRLPDHRLQPPPS